MNVYMLHLLYPFRGAAAPLITLLGYCEYSCNKHGSADVSLVMLIYIPLDICPRVVWQGHKVSLPLVFEEPPY
jgi:hypothetical protein